MLVQSSLPNEEPPLHLQVEAERPALSQDVAPQRETRFLRIGFGFAVLALLGVSACALLPIAPHAFAKHSHVAFNPSQLPRMRPGALHHVAKRYARAPSARLQNVVTKTMHIGPKNRATPGIRGSGGRAEIDRDTRQWAVTQPVLDPESSKVASTHAGAATAMNAATAAQEVIHKDTPGVDEALTQALRQRREYLLGELDEVTKQLGAEAVKGRAKLGSKKSVFEPSFGYLSQSAGVYTDSIAEDGSRLPSNLLDLGVKNFKREFPNMLAFFNGSQTVSSQDSKEAAEMRAKLDMLVLDNDKVWAREKLRPAVDAPLALLAPYYVLCAMLDTLFEGRPIARFWFLETVARVPYFAYISSLHLYETLGWWRRSAESKRVHFAEEWNEFHHLLTMEALGGDQMWQDRFLAQHSAIVYYFILIGVWMTSPSLAYKFSELIEAHAVDTYGEFADANREILASLPAPRVTRQYYLLSDEMFDTFQSTRPKGSRTVQCETLLDVFINIRDDEQEHVNTMAACQDPEELTKAKNVQTVLGGTAILGALAAGLVEFGLPAALAEAFSVLWAGSVGTLGAEALINEQDTMSGLGEIGNVAKETFKAAKEAEEGGVDLLKGPVAEAIKQLLP